MAQGGSLTALPARHLVKPLGSDRRILRAFWPKPVSEGRQEPKRQAPIAASVSLGLCGALGTERSEYTIG